MKKMSWHWGWFGGGSEGSGQLSRRTTILRYHFNQGEMSMRIWASNFFFLEWVSIDWLIKTTFSTNKRTNIFPEFKTSFCLVWWFQFKINCTSSLSLSLSLCSHLTITVDFKNNEQPSSHGSTGLYLQRTNFTNWFWSRLETETSMDK